MTGRARDGLAARARRLAPAWALAALLACAPSSGRAAGTDVVRHLAGGDGCFVLLDLGTGRVVVRSDPARCAERTSPCSTFKVPLALMALDAGILADEHSRMAWDGVDRGVDAWNRDQTAASWMRGSVVWFSQVLTPRLGAGKLKHYLAGFQYGNQDLSGGLTTAWLDSSLQISPDEQARFLERLWRGELPVSRHALETTRRLTFLETSPSGWTLHGKTGSGQVRAGERDARRMGWFVGRLARNDRELVFAIRYVDRPPAGDDRPGGWVARELAKLILSELGLY